MTPEQRASEELFGTTDYAPQHPDREYVADNGEWITYTELVERYRNEDQLK